MARLGKAMVNGSVTYCLFCNLVEAGEHAGVLETLLDKIATYKEKTESMKKIKKALTYPVAVIVVAFIVTAVLA
jgi:type IV pilus assembly protein PilC